MVFMGERSRKKSGWPTRSLAASQQKPSPMKVGGLRPGGTEWTNNSRADRDSDKLWFCRRGWPGEGWWERGKARLHVLANQRAIATRQRTPEIAQNTTRQTQ